MKDSEPTFDRVELGQLLIRLQSVCVPCMRSRGEGICSLESACPMGVSRSLLMAYMYEDIRIHKGVDPSSLASMPKGLDINRSPLNQVAERIPILCNRCMFHADKCFLNLIYLMLDIALKNDPPKQLSIRPKLSNAS